MDEIELPEGPADTDDEPSLPPDVRTDPVTEPEEEAK